MLSLNLDDFSVLTYQPGFFTRAPEVTLRPDMIIFNASSMKMLGDPNHVRLLFDVAGKRLAIQGKSKESKETINLHPDRKYKYLGVYDTSLVKSIMDQLGLDLTYRYKASGVYHEEENVMLYNLSNSTKTVHKPVKQ